LFTLENSSFIHVLARGVQYEGVQISVNTERFWQCKVNGEKNEHIITW
jgi:hypothetical protein